MTKIKYIILLLLTYLSVQSQDLDTNKFKITLEMGGGLSYKTSKDINLIYNYNNLGFAGMLRIKFVPESRLNIGIETGLIHISTIETGEIITTNNGNTNERIVQNAYPILLDFSMQFDDLQVIAGLGYYYVTIKSNARNPELSFQSSDWSMGYLIGANYKFKISKHFDLLPEIKYYLLTDVQHNLLAFQVNLKYNILKW